MRRRVFRHLVTVTRNNQADDGGGGTIETPVVIGQVWLDDEPLTIRDIERFAAVEIEATDRLTARFGADIQSGDIIEFGGRCLEVKTVRDPEGRKRELEIIAREVTR